MNKDKSDWKERFDEFFVGTKTIETPARNLNINIVKDWIAKELETARREAMEGERNVIRNIIKENRDIDFGTYDIENIGADVVKYISSLKSGGKGEE